MIRSCVDVSHNPDLIALLTVVALVDANSVSPQCRPAVRRRSHALPTTLTARKLGVVRGYHESRLVVPPVPELPNTP
jgi:hypothetical protein